MLAAMLMTITNLDVSRSFGIPPDHAIAQAVASPERSAADRQRDASSHPAEVLTFLGLRHGATCSI